MDLRSLLLRYAWHVVWTRALQRVIRSPRIVLDPRWGEVLFAAFLFSLVAIPAMFASYAWWVLTGRGPVRWLKFQRYVLVDPWPRRPLPPELAEALRRREGEWAREAIATDPVAAAAAQRGARDGAAGHLVADWTEDERETADRWGFHAWNAYWQAYREAGGVIPG